MTEKILNNDEVDKLANVLYESYNSQSPLKISDFSQNIDDDSAYKVQHRLTELKNRKLGGYKISLTSKETQDLFKASEPLYGAQIKDRFFTTNAKLKMTMFMDALVEVELVFTAKEDLSFTDSLEELMRKTTIAPGIEVPDCRFKDWFPKLPKDLVISDAAVGGAVIYGKEVDTDKFSLDQLAEIHADLFHDTKQIADGNSSEVLGNPIKSLKWLVEKLNKTDQILHKGEKVSTGTFLLPVKLTSGMWKADFDHDLGSVEFEVK